MEEDLGIFQCIASLKNKGHIEVYLNSLKDNRISCENVNANNAIHTISSLLMRQESRELGLQILVSVIQKYPVESLEPKVNLWTSLAIKGCNLPNQNRYSSIMFEALEKLVIKSKLSIELTKSFSCNHLLKIYEVLPNISSSSHLSALRCIETCLRLYPGGSGLAKDIIERFLKQFIDTTDSEISYVCGKCHHLLLQVCGGGVQGMNHKTQWQNYQLRIIGSLQAVLETSFSKCRGLQCDNISCDQLDMTVLNLSDEPVQRAAQLYIRFRNLMGYFVTSLCDPFSVEKLIMPTKILKLINHGIAVTNLMLQQNPISDNIALGIFLPKMHYHLLELLHVIILKLHSHLKPYHTYVAEIVTDVLKYTSWKQSKNVHKLCTYLRVKTYDIISLWSRTLGSGSRCEEVVEFTIYEIFDDITPINNRFTLQVLSSARKHLSKKARKQLHKLQNEKSNLTQKGNVRHNSARTDEGLSESNQQLCIAALHCLQEIILRSSIFLKPTLIKMIENKIFEICFLFYDTNNYELYNNWSCRFQIYNILAALISPHHLCPPSTQITLTILQKGSMTDNNSEVRQYCSTLLLRLEKILHPQKENLKFPIEERDLRNTFIKLGQERLIIEHCNNYTNSINDFEPDCQSDIVVAETNEEQSNCDVPSLLPYVVVNDTIIVESQKLSCKTGSTKSSELSHGVECSSSDSTKGKRASCYEKEEHTLKAPSLAKKAKENRNENFAFAKDLEKETEQELCLPDDENFLMADVEAAFIDE